MNGTVTRGVILRRGHAERFAIGSRERHDRLDRTFAKAGLSDDDGPLEILQSAGNHFTAAGTGSIDQDHHRILPVALFVVSPNPVGSDLSGTGPSLSSKHHRSRRDKFADDVDGGVQQTSRIVPEVQDKCFHSLLFKVIESSRQFSRRRFIELEEPGVSNFVWFRQLAVQKMNIDQRVLFEDFAHHFQLQQLLGGGTVQGELEFFSRFATEQIDRFRQTDVLGQNAVDFQYLIPGQHAGAGGGTVFPDRDDGQGLVLRRDGDADAFVSARSVALQLLVNFGGEELAMRVEIPQHSLKR